MESIHGRALLKMGLIVAPSCDDCHGVHDIKRAVDRDSPINHANVAKTCGKCHLGVEETYDQSIHGQLLAKGDPRGPVCTDCHTAHEIVNPEGTNFKALSDERCGKCHADRLEDYRDTYHGKAVALGRPNVAPQVAACYDCHGYHDIQPPSDPRSHLSKANILATCQQCHPGATIGFTEYSPHANPLDGKNYPAAPRGVRADDGLADRRVRLFRPAHPGMAGARDLSLPARLEDNSARRRFKRRWTANGSRASRRSSASCTSWW